MIIDNYSKSVRVRKEFGNSFENFHDDVFVEQLVNNEWVVRHTFNTISNDYAYSTAREYALELATQKS